MTSTCKRSIFGGIFFVNTYQKIPKANAFGIFLSKPLALAYHHASACIFLRLDDIQSVRFDDIQFLAELMIYTPLA